MGYNCLAVDLRSGGGVNFVQNETANLAKEKGFATTYLDAEKDMLAAIDYAWGKSHKPMILFGSSYSASLALRIAKGNSKVSIRLLHLVPANIFNLTWLLKDQINGFEVNRFLQLVRKENLPMSAIYWLMFLLI